jgi:thiol-disulfide isomerase/thioredoxin
MIETTKESFKSLIQGSKVVVFFHKVGCANCDKIKPMLEKYEQENADVKICSYLCTVPDEVTKDYPFNTFPGIFHFESGKLRGGTSGMIPDGIIGLPFQDINVLKLAVYDGTTELTEMDEKASTIKLKLQLSEQAIGYKTGKTKQPGEEEIKKN